MMKTMQWMLATGAALALGPASARADTVASAEPGHAAVTQPERIDLAAVPADCRDLAVPADSTSELLAWDQRLSLAACEQDTSVAAAVTGAESLSDLVASIVDSDRRSIASYRDAAAHGPTRIRIAGAYWLGMTFINVMVRSRIALPHDASLSLHRALEPLTASYAHDANLAFADVERLASEPGLDASDAVTGLMIRSARALRLALGAN